MNWIKFDMHSFSTYPEEGEPVLVRVWKGQRMFPGALDFISKIFYLAEDLDGKKHWRISCPHCSEKEYSLEFVSHWALIEIPEEEKKEQRKRIDNLINRMKRVTHWQPVSKPPKEDKKS